MTLEIVYMEVKVKTKYEVHIYIMWALQCVRDNLLKKAYHLLGAARKVVPISEDWWRKSKLNITLETGYMEVKVNTK